MVGAAELLSRHTFQTSDGVTLSILESGGEHKPGLTIALIPGWSMPAYLWQRQLEELDAVTTRSLWTRVGRANLKSRALATRQSVEPLTYAIFCNPYPMFCSWVGLWAQSSRSNTLRCSVASDSLVWLSSTAL